MALSLPPGSKSRGLGLLAALAASFLVLVAVRRSPPPLQVDVGSEGDQRFLAGFGPSQIGGSGTFRWSRSEARLLLHGAYHPSARLSLSLDPGPRATRVHVSYAGVPVGTLDVVRGWHDYDLRLPGVDTLRSQRLPPIVNLSVEQPLPGADGESLGVKLGAFLVLPDAASAASLVRAAPRAAVLTWSLGLVAAWWWRLGARSWGPRAPSLWRLVAFLGLLSFVAAAERRNPYASAWLYPFPPVALTALSLGLLLRRGARGEASPLPPFGAPLRRLSRGEIVALVGVFVLALSMRFHRIGELPWAMWRDEARHGLVGIAMLESPSYRPLFVAHADLPALGLYPFALAVHVFGIHTWSLRPVTALAGALTVLPLYGLARRLSQNTQAALLAAGLLALSSWHVSISRLSYATILEPLFTLTGLWMMAKAVEAGAKMGRALWAGGAGLCFAVAFQTYHTGRLAPLFAAGLALVAIRGRLARWREFLPVALVFAAGVAPILLYAWEHRAEVNRRMSQVNLLTRAERSGEAPLAALDASLGRHLLMFNWRGDANGRHHAPDEPLLDAVSGLGFLAGLAIAIRNRQRTENLLLLGALGLTLVPGLLTVDGPHAGRTIGAAPFACLLAALGWVEIKRRSLLPARVLLGPLVVAGSLNAWTYFVAMPVDPRVWGASYPVATQMGVFVRNLANTRQQQQLSNVLVPGEVGRNEVFEYLSYGLRVATFEEEPPAPLLSRDTLVLFPGDPRGVPPPLRPFDPQDLVPAVAGPSFPGLAVPSFMAYRRGTSSP